ncbi:anthranilate synthase component II [Porphyromonas circumdentaria]|uniref:Anthranilate synthase, component II n=1 Tax=Porphyromonas circumdentaria TaxID=29524 RepID=A0A1T4MLF4_9PORP|nr:aminodeoxychorismate/anthranilate synthase component II [Porphyromonas circumdentaria]MBB6275857.1 anthranilate synthase component 2/para-aminobenzoate synthetase component 2 [Porphyromonas circumdentaria]MDO4722400.1 aminodeoxychorismate/anthranilate synthase component II [Porphyromonas circumdentaria]SJZ67711.1 anthranilate synthase, component II [Porphyromonas circumdentaria]
MAHILVADCHDSFVYNLIEIIRNTDGCSYEVYPIEVCGEMQLDTFDALLLSPGPGHPTEMKGLFDLIERTYRRMPIMGVCLGLQALACFFGGNLRQLSRPLHGHADYLRLSSPTEEWFSAFPLDSCIGRYHSWVVDEETFPKELRVVAYAKSDNTIMALRHRSLPIYAVQFHPESYISLHGAELIKYWLRSIQ